jgi:hypothetical protein
VLLLLCVVLAGAGALLSARWYAARVDELGRRRRYPLTPVVCFELAVVAAVPIVRLAAEQHRLGTVASELAGAPATVHCQHLASAMADLSNDLGHVHVGPDGRPEHATLIKNEQCRLLASYLDGHQHRPSHQEVVAVHVLTHESMHMGGITSEAAELLGAAPDDARRLALHYWLTVYPFMPDEYRSVDCGPGRALDEHLPTAPWAAHGP